MMKKHFRNLLLFGALMGMILALMPLKAQLDEYSCEDGENYILDAVESAFYSNNHERAWELMNQASIMCVDAEAIHTELNALRTRTTSKLDLDLNQPGEVDLGEYQIYMNCMGEGVPTILFESGFEQSAFQWWQIQAPLSTVTRTCAYSRMGVNPSSEIPEGVLRTTQDEVDTLISVLDTAEIEGPFVVVGHSIAGYNILLLTDQYPDLIAGIVLVDARHPEQDQRDLAAGYEMPDMSELKFDFLTSGEQALQVTDFEDRPVYVLTAQYGSGRNADWVELQEVYASYSTNSVQAVAERSDHNIPSSRPDLVIKAVLWVLEELQTEQ